MKYRVSRHWTEPILFVSTRVKTRFDISRWLPFHFLWFFSTVYIICSPFKTTISQLSGIGITAQSLISWRSHLFLGRSDLTFHTICTPWYLFLINHGINQIIRTNVTTPCWFTSNKFFLAFPVICYGFKTDIFSFRFRQHDFHWEDPPGLCHCPRGIGSGQTP